MEASKLRTGHKVLIAGEPYVVLTYQLKKLGRAGSKVVTKLKNLVTGSTVEKTFNGGFKLDEADITNVAVKYLYNDGSTYFFMDNETFEQFEFPLEKIGDTKDYLVEDSDMYVMCWNGNPINVDLPPVITLEVVNTDPGVKGDTAQGGSKPATLQTGAVIQVPLFINIGDKIVVNTASGEYRERVKN